MSSKRERSSFSTPLLSKRQKDGNSGYVKEQTIQVRVNDISMLHQLVQIGSSVSHTSEISIQENRMTFRGMDSSQLSCYTAQISAETPDFPFSATGTHGPFFVDLTLVEPAINIKLYEKLNHSSSQDLAYLLIRIKPNERISLSMAGLSDQRICYSGRHRVNLLDSSPVSVAVESLVYTETVKFPVDYLKAILNQLSQMKFTEVEFSIYKSGNHSALRIFAKSLRNECEHNFFSSGPPNTEMCFSRDSAYPESSGVGTTVDVSDMQLIICQTFLLANISNVVKPMKDHDVRFSFATDQPLLIRSDFNSNSQFKYFLSFVYVDGDSLSDLPPIPEAFAPQGSSVVRDDE
jgi:hypothetical protein